MGTAKGEKWTLAVKLLTACLGLLAVVIGLSWDLYDRSRAASNTSESTAISAQLGGAGPVDEMEQDDESELGANLPPGARPSEPADTTRIHPPTRTATVHLADGDSVELPSLPGTASVTFSDDFGGFATLLVMPEGGSPVSEAVYGPGGTLTLNARGQNRSVTVAGLDLTAKKISLLVH
jgi:hypothetical protein